MLEKKGNYHFLAISIDEYPAQNKSCSGSEKSAKKISKILIKKYGFLKKHVNTKSLRGRKAKRKRILRILRSYEPHYHNQLGPDDVLVVFFSGEGGMQSPGNNGFLKPYNDLGSEDTDNAIFFDELCRRFSRINAGHILFICDCCFSGSIVEGSERRSSQQIYEAYTRKSRQAITSGALEKTDDGRKNGISTFSQALIAALSGNKQRELRVSNFFDSVYEPVNKKTRQEPTYRDLKGCGGEPEGELVLFLDEEYVDNPIDNPPYGFSKILKIKGKRRNLADYLRSDVQEYYGWKRHSEEGHKYAPINENEFVDEQELANRVIDNPKPLVIIGQGGIGKTRLTIELCKLASQKDWHALFINSYANEKSLEEILSFISKSSMKLILIVDYLEKSERIIKFDRIFECVSQNKDKLRLIATCRSNYLRAQEGARAQKLNNDDCFLFEISRQENHGYAKWLNSWIAASHRSIYPESEANVKAVPAVAIIEKYANDLDRKQVGENSYGWMTNLLLRSLNVEDPHQYINQYELSQFLSCFDASAETIEKIRRNPKFKQLFLDLKYDGWIVSEEHTDGQSVWKLGHDLLADYVLIDQFKNEDKFGYQILIEDILGFGCFCENIESASDSLLRVSGTVLKNLKETDKLPLFELLIKKVSELSVVNRQLMTSTLRSVMYSAWATPDRKLEIIFEIAALDQDEVNSHNDLVQKENTRNKQFHDFIPVCYLMVLFRAFGCSKQYIVDFLKQTFIGKKSYRDVALVEETEFFNTLLTLYRLRNIDDLSKKVDELTKFSNSEFSNEHIIIPHVNYHIGNTYIEEGDYEKSLSFLQKNIGKISDNTDQRAKYDYARSYNAIAFAFTKMGDFDEAYRYSSLLLALELDGDGVKFEQTKIEALCRKSFCLLNLERFEECIKICNKVIEEFSAADDLGLRTRTAEAKIRKGNALMKLGRENSAIKSYEDVIETCAGTNSIALDGEFATACNLTGEYYEKIGKKRKATRQYKKVIGNYSNSTDEKLRYECFFALSHLQVISFNSTEYDLAAEYCKKLISEYANETDLQYRRGCATALNIQGQARSIESKCDIANSIFDFLYEKFSNDEDVAVRRECAAALNVKVENLVKQGLHDDAYKVSEEVILAYENERDEKIELECLKSFNFIVGQKFRNAHFEEAKSWGETALTRYQLKKESSAAAILAELINNTAHSKIELGEHQAVIEVTDSLISLHSEHIETAVKVRCLEAFLIKAKALNNLGKTRSAIKIIDFVLSDYESVDSIAIKFLFADAINLKAYFLTQINNYLEAYNTSQYLIDNYRKCDGLSFSQNLIEAMCRKAYCKFQQNEMQECADICDEILAKYEGNEDPVIKFRWAEAVRRKSHALQNLDLKDYEGAISLIEKLFDRYSDDCELSFKRFAAKSYNDLTALCEKNTNFETAITYHGNVLQKLYLENDETVENQCYQASLKLIQPLIILGQWQYAVESGKFILRHLPSSCCRKAIIVFLLWLIECDEVSTKTISDEIATQPKNREYRWSFEPLLAHINNLPKVRKSIAVEFISFFKGEISRDKLLQKISRTPSRI